jgi:hypothetical protein
MSDIVKRRSIRVFGAAVKGRERRAISMHLLRRKLLPDANVGGA